MAALESLTPPYGFTNFDVTDFDPEQPWDNYRALGVALNPLALFNGESTIKIQTAAYGDNTITSAKLEASASGAYTSFLTEKNVAGTTAGHTKIYEAKVAQSGTVSVQYKVSRSGGSLSYARSQVYVNGVAAGTLHNGVASATHTEDIAVSAGDLIQIYDWYVTYTSTYTYTLFSISAADPIALVNGNRSFI